MDNLQGSLSALNKTRQQAETGRRFSQSYEDPVASSKAVVLETRYARNLDYQATIEQTNDWQASQEGVISQLSKQLSEISDKVGKEALNGVNGDQRESYAKTMREMQKTMVFTLNAKFGDTHVAAGNDGANPPFAIDDDGDITYRNLKLNDPANQAELEKLAQETAYVDVGIGIKFEAGEVVSSSAFDTAMPGIGITGYKIDADGYSENALVLVGELAEQLESGSFDRDEYEKILGKLSTSVDKVKDSFTEIGTKTQFLDATLENLKAEEVNIIEQFDTTVNIDEAKALMNYSYAQYVHSLSLKMGTNILTPSLLDFVR